MTKFLITSTDPRGNRFFYAGNGRWTDEYPDAWKFGRRFDAELRINAALVAHPDNRTWQGAIVERVD